MDKKRSILNVGVAVFFKIPTMVAAIFVTQSLIRIFGNAVNGLNSLYISILDILAVAELGVGTAITFCMYRPIVEGNETKVSALYHLFRRWYLAVGGVILVCGLALTPFIHLFARDYAQVDVNLYTSFLLMLVSVVLTYLFGAKTALINAYKNNYITTAIRCGGLLLQYVLQIVVLYATRSFSAYLLCRSIAVIVQWVITNYLSERDYARILSGKAKADRDTKREVGRQIKAMFAHKIGLLLVNTVDSLVISMFIGVAALGIYSNYIVIQSAMDGVIRLLFTSLSSVVGHMFVEKSKEISRRYCDALHMVNFMVGTVFYLGYYAVIDDLIAILFGEALIAQKAVPMVITMNSFVSFMRCNTLVFRDATGMFYHDRWRPLLEGLMNLILSVLLVQRIGIVGVIAATIFTNLVICHVVEPYVLYKNAFGVSVGRYYLRNYGMILLFGAGLVLSENLMQNVGGHWRSLLINGTISVGVSLLLCAAVFCGNKEIRQDLKRMAKNSQEF